MVKLQSGENFIGNLTQNDYHLEEPMVKLQSGENFIGNLTQNDYQHFCRVEIALSSAKIASSQVSTVLGEICLRETSAARLLLQSRLHIWHEDFGILAPTGLSRSQKSGSQTSTQEH